MSCAGQRWERAACSEAPDIAGRSGAWKEGKSTGVREMDQKTISTSLARWFQMCGNRTRSRSPTVTEHDYRAMPWSLCKDQVKAHQPT